ncbi:MAG: type II toxin-antitoxin system RelE/ParE family toxin [Verrucomicrobiota bacterium]
MAKVIYSPQADRDLDDIWDYVAQDSLLQADRLWDRFRAKLEYLAKWNTIGRLRPELTQNCRSYPFGKYCFYYRPTEAGIEVLRILHSARDIGEINFQE